MLTIKGTGWSYEQEARIIREKDGTFSVPKEFLKQICFGLNASESDMHLIRKIIESIGYTVDYYQIAKKESDFGIEAVKI